MFVWAVSLDAGARKTPNRPSPGPPRPAVTEARASTVAEPPSSTVTEAPRPPQETPSSTAKPQPVRNITIDRVELANPLVVTGTARTFEKIGRASCREKV